MQSIMLFNSLEFLLFFVAITTLFFTIPSRFQWMVLLVGSYVFYMCWKPVYILLIIASTLVDYYCGARMGEVSHSSRRRYLAISLITNLALLFFFKYFNFFNDSIREVFQQLNLSYAIPALNILLPVGISFYTFQTLSYSIDVYRGHQAPERHLGRFALYVSFFPQLVAGPIERSIHLLPQFTQTHVFDPDRVTSGLRLILWGFFKKIVIADRLALYVNMVYNNPTDFHGLSLILATYFFAFQIYCDFSGYSDIAIGCARVLGFDLMINFKQPYFSQSISEFWSRWHISLSTWFKDYLYIPLGGNRVVRWRWFLNLYVVFLVSGLWHGANWTFVVWGALHGLYVVVGAATADVRARLRARLQVPAAWGHLGQMVLTFHAVTVAWIYFRANTLADANYIVSHLFSLAPSSLRLGPSAFTTALTGLLLAIFILLECLLRFGVSRRIASWRPGCVVIAYPAYCLMLITIFLFGVSANQFIYFQF
jgi:alginate O-acetyltransferase complex protein AlgI